MLTKLGKYLASYPNQNGSAFIMGTTLSSNSKGAVKFKNVDGNVAYFPVGYYAESPSVRISSSMRQAGIFIGSGDAAASEDDYALESLIASGLTASNPARQYSYDSTNNLTLCTYVITLTNNGSSDVIVKEIGKVIETYGASAIGAPVSTSPKAYAMIDRTVLDSPVTVEANGSAVIHYTFCYPGYIGEE